MRRPRRLIAVLGLSTVAAAGVAALVTTGGSVTTASASNTLSSVGPTGAGLGAPGTSPISGSQAGPLATVRTATATVGGVSETILVNRDGIPLYTYGPDTATASMVSGELAALWPPLTVGSLGVRGAPGKLAIVTTANGHQLTFNGHFLYTFVEDRPGIVTGQGVQNFMVATPAIANIASSSNSAGSIQGSASSGSLPGY